MSSKAASKAVTLAYAYTGFVKSYFALYLFLALHRFVPKGRSALTSHHTIFFYYIAMRVMAGGGGPYFTFYPFLRTTSLRV